MKEETNTAMHYMFLMKVSNFMGKKIETVSYEHFFKYYKMFKSYQSYINNCDDEKSQFLHLSKIGILTYITDTPAKIYKRIFKVR